MVAQWWQVVGGGTEGLICREGRDPWSAELPERLPRKAVLEEEEIDGNNLAFIRLKGKGPDFGWVTIAGGDGKDVLAKVATPKHAKSSPRPTRPPPKPPPPPPAPPPPPKEPLYGADGGLLEDDDDEADDLPTLEAGDEVAGGEVEKKVVWGSVKDLLYGRKEPPPLEIGKDDFGGLRRGFLDPKQENVTPKLPSPTWTLGGEWNSKNGKKLIIAGGLIRWDDGGKTKLEAKGKSKFFMNIGGQSFHANVTDDGKLVWSDGDIWTRIDT